MPENDQMPPTPGEQQAVDELNRQIRRVSCPTCGVTDPTHHPTVAGTDTIQPCNDAFHVLNEEPKAEEEKTGAPV